MINLTSWPNLNADNRGADWNVESWDEVFERLSQHERYRGDWEHPGWSPAVFKPCFRALAHVERVAAMCFDYDSGEALDAIAGRLGAVASGFLHTTRKHAPGAPRCRVVLPMTRTVSAFEFPELWKRLEVVVGKVDTQTKDPSRFWFLPGSAEHFEIRKWPGELLNPDAWLAKPDPTPRPVIVRTPAPRGMVDVEERARRYIAKMPPSVSGQGGHIACWEVALRLARGFALSYERTLAILREDFNPRCDPPWSEKDLAHKAEDAVNSERVEFGFLLKDERGWTPSSARLPPPADIDEHDAAGDHWVVDDPEEAEREAIVAELSTRHDVEISEPTPQKSATERYGVIELRALCFEVLADAKTGKAKRGHTTGNYEIDNVISGLRSSHVTLLAAGTSWGKSSFGVMVADENMRLGVPVLVVTVEDSALMYGKRIVARRGELNGLRLRDNDLDGDEIRMIENVAMAAPDEPFLLSGVGKTVEHCARGIVELVAERKIGVVICDYLQRFRTQKNFGSDRRNQVTYVGETLSDAIKQSGAAGLLISQLKRTDQKKPTMEDIKESGDLENMAEHVLIGHKTQEHGPRYEGSEPPWKRTLSIPKNKDGPTSTGDIECPFNEVTASFETVRDPEGPRLQRLREAAEGESAFSDFDARYGS